MSEVTDAEVEAIDSAVVAYRDEGEWNVAALPEASRTSLEAITNELRRYPGETGALAMLSVDEDFLIFVRVVGPGVRVLLSDATAATDWELAREVLDTLGFRVDDDEEQAPAGDLAIFADMGFSAAELGELLDDFDLYPEEILAEIATNLGFGAEYERLLGS